MTSLASPAQLEREFGTPVATQAPTATSAALAPTWYTNHVTVRPEMRLHWNITGAGANRSIAFALEYSTTTGWLGFGVGEPASGSMAGADIMVASIGTDGRLTVGDYFATAESRPTADGTPSDWVGVGYSRTANTTIVEATRLLAVTDTAHDRAIVDDGKPTKLIFAFGASASLQYHGANRAQYSINLFDPMTDRLAAVATRNDTESLQWLRDNFTIPAAVTTYVEDLCFTGPSTAGGTPYMIAARPRIQPGNEMFVHHMVLKGFLGSANCTGNSVDLLATASHASPFIFPDGVGIDLGMFTSFTVQTHYDNAMLMAGVVDSSGVEVFYTRTPREHKAGILQLGDPAVRTPGTLPSGLSAFTYECPANCTNKWTSNITVFATLQHMHKTGVMMRTQYARGENVLRTVKTEYYDFDLQDEQLLQPFVVQRGDRMATTCTYQTSGGVKWGIGSDDEMCIDFLYYYPIQTVLEGFYCGYNLCGSMTSLASPAQLEREFGTPVATQAPTATTAFSSTSTATMTGTSTSTTSTATALSPTISAPPSVTATTAVNATAAPLMNSLTATNTTTLPIATASDTPTGTVTTTTVSGVPGSAQIAITASITLRGQRFAALLASNRASLEQKLSNDLAALHRKALSPITSVANARRFSRQASDATVSVLIRSLSAVSDGDFSLLSIDYTVLVQGPSAPSTATATATVAADLNALRQSTNLQALLPETMISYASQAAPPGVTSSDSVSVVAASIKNDAVASVSPTCGIPCIVGISVGGVILIAAVVAAIAMSQRRAARYPKFNDYVREAERHQLAQQQFQSLLDPHSHHDIDLLERPSMPVRYAPPPANRR